MTTTILYRSAAILLALGTLGHTLGGMLGMARKGPQGGAEGVIIAQAGRFAGWSLYMKGGRVHHVYNFGGLERTTVSSPSPLAPGRHHTVLYEFAYDGGAPGSGGSSRLSIDGARVGEVRVPRTMPFAYSGDEGVDVGTDNETPVTEEYREGDNAFTGTIHKVTVSVLP